MEHEGLAQPRAARAPSRSAPWRQRCAAPLASRPRRSTGSTHGCSERRDITHTGCDTAIPTTTALPSPQQLHRTTTIALHPQKLFLALAPSVVEVECGLQICCIQAASSNQRLLPQAATSKALICPCLCQMFKILTNYLTQIKSWWFQIDSVLGKLH